MISYYKISVKYGLRTKFDFDSELIEFKLKPCEEVNSIRKLVLRGT